LERTHRQSRLSGIRHRREHHHRPATRTLRLQLQSPRQKVLAVPFAMNAQRAETSSGVLAKQISDLSKDLALLSGGIPSSFKEDS